MASHTLTRLALTSAWSSLVTTCHWDSVLRQTSSAPLSPAPAGRTSSFRRAPYPTAASRTPPDLHVAQPRKTRTREPSTSHRRVNQPHARASRSPESGAGLFRYHRLTVLCTCEWWSISVGMTVEGVDSRPSPVLHVVVRGRRPRSGDANSGGIRGRALTHAPQAVIDSDSSCDWASNNIRRSHDRSIGLHERSVPIPGIAKVLSELPWWRASEPLNAANVPGSPLTNQHFYRARSPIK